MLSGAFNAFGCLIWEDIDPAKWSNNRGYLTLKESFLGGTYRGSQPGASICGLIIKMVLIQRGIKRTTNVDDYCGSRIEIVQGAIKGPHEVMV